MRTSTRLRVITRAASHHRRGSYSCPVAVRARRSGAIVNVSSIGAQITPVGSGYYSAAKAALEGLSGALHGELAPLGISVTIVEPGAFRTDSLADHSPSPQR